MTTDENDDPTDAELEEVLKYIGDSQRALDLCGLTGSARNPDAYGGSEMKVNLTADYEAWRASRDEIAEAISAARLALASSDMVTSERVKVYRLLTNLDERTANKAEATRLNGDRAGLVNAIHSWCPQCDGNGMVMGFGGPDDCPNLDEHRLLASLVSEPIS